MARLDITAIKANIAMLTLMAEHGHEPVKREGREHVFLCPWHKDSRPSLKINPERGVFKCFSSGCPAARGGDQIDLAVLLFAIDEGNRQHNRVAAARRLARGVEVDPSPLQEPTPPGTKRDKQGDPPLDPTINSPINPPLGFELQSVSVEEGIAYAKARGISEEVARTFGLAVAKKGGFRNRLVIPLHDHDGILVGYAARALDDVTEPKYLMPPREKGFYKSHLLFNLHRIRPEAKRVIIVEGFFDVMNLYQHGFHNVVAAMGTDISEAHIALLKSKSHFLAAHLFFDGDRAGEEGSSTAAAKLVDHLWVKRVWCPEGDQPEHLGRDELCDLLRERTPLQASTHMRQNTSFFHVNTR